MEYNDSPFLTPSQNQQLRDYFASSSAENLLSENPSINTDYQFGDWITGRSSAKEQQANQAQLDTTAWLRSEASAKAQREWEEYMSNTQVQRSMKDLEAAGLNPWLAVQSAGFGGSVPSGAAGNSSASNLSAAGTSSLGTSFGSTAIGLAMLIKTIAKVIK